MKKFSFSFLFLKWNMEKKLNKKRELTEIYPSTQFNRYDVIDSKSARLPLRLRVPIFL